jgi:hypothetical protein
VLTPYIKNAYLLLLGELLNKKLHNKVKPSACQKVKVINPKILGINQFHNHITGKDINNPINTAVPITTKIFTTVSIFILFLINICF